jgi:hypothetical protein
METFADVLHAIIDAVFSGDVAAKAHTIIDSASGTRTAEEDLAEPAADSATPAPADEAAPADEVPGSPAGDEASAS